MELCFIMFVWIIVIKYNFFSNFLYRNADLYYFKWYFFVLKTNVLNSHKSLRYIIRLMGSYVWMRWTNHKFNNIFLLFFTKKSSGYLQTYVGLPWCMFSTSKKYCNCSWFQLWNWWQKYRILENNIIVYKLLQK